MKGNDYCDKHFMLREQVEENRRDMKTLHADLNWVKGLLIVLITAILGVNAL